MKQKITITILIFISLCWFSPAQQAPYTVTLAAFSTDKYDEFSPVYYKNGIVFCSNRNTNSLSDISGIDNRGQIDLFYIDTTGNVSQEKSKLFSKELKTRLNDGPATFSSGGDTIYFTRNLRVEGNLNELAGWRNNLGIFYAVYDGKKWKEIREFRFTNEIYNLVTPFLSTDGSTMYFASDRPDGFGGLDLYYSKKKNGYWDDPVNMGALINTTGNESYPFINEAGELFFSSDGHDGFGGKDIYVTKQRSSGWYPPVRLDEPINSEYDDFGIVYDPVKNEGYFSSGRNNSIDIFHFRSNSYQFWFSEPQKENHYCLTVSDTGSIVADTQILQYVWNFGNGTKINGPIAHYCFPGQGNYSITLDLIDRKTGKLFFHKLKYDIDLFDIDQPFISSPDVAVAGEPVEIDGLKSECPGFEITGYQWDFGDGTNGVGEKLNHIYGKSGEFIIKMGLNLKSQNTGVTEKRIVSRKITVFGTVQEKNSHLSNVNELKLNFLDIKKLENIKINSYYSAENDFRKESMFHVVLFSSKTQTIKNNTVLKNLPSKYNIRELFDQETGEYRYIIDQQMTLMAAYQAYSESIAAGFKDAMVRIYVLKDPAEKDLYKIMKKYSLLTDDNFDAGNRLTTPAYVLMDQIATLMINYPQAKIMIGVHTDNQGVMSNNLSVSQLRAQVIVNYLTTRGISISRLSAKGFGGTRPIVSNNYPSNRMLNRRIDFTLTNENK